MKFREGDLVKLKADIREERRSGIIDDREDENTIAFSFGYRKFPPRYRVKVFGEVVGYWYNENEITLHPDMKKLRSFLK